MSECNCERKLQGERIKDRLSSFEGLDRACSRYNIDLMDLSDRDTTLMDLGKIIMREWIREK
jgi:hypothetical protein